MTDPNAGERSLTSDCGTVTVTIAAGGQPRIELAPSAERMFTRDLAQLVTATAREAAHAAADALPDTGPGLADAVAELTALTEDLRERGYSAVIGERAEAAANEEGTDEEGTDEDDAAAYGGGTGARRRTTAEALGSALGESTLRLYPGALKTLDSTIALLQRFQETPAGTGKGEEPGPVGRAKSESKLVAVESTNEHPVSTVWLSKRSLEIGARGLTGELNETVQAAYADLLDKQGGYFAGLGLQTPPIGLADGLARGEAFRTDAAEFTTEMRDAQERITRLLKDGGHFG